MKKYISILAIITISSFLVSPIISCKEDDDNLIDGPTINGTEVEKTLNSATIEWGISKEKVKKHMEGYNSVSSQGNNFLLFSNKGNSRFISYKFRNDSLYSTLILLPQMAEDADLGDILKGYTFVGELDNTDVYQNNSKNSLVCAYEVTKDTTKYQAVGFTPINSSLISTLAPITVTTGETDIIKYNSVTLCGNITGVTEKVKVGVYYDKDRTLPVSSRKTKTANSMGDFTIQITGLTEQTTYYYQMYAIIDNIYYYGETKSFTTTKDVIYQTGDWYPNTVSPIGIVFYTANSGRSGKIVSLDYETGLAWDANGENSKSASCSSTTDGSNNDMPKDSPVAKWVANHGSGWYCPSRSELVSLNNNLSKVNSTLSSKGYSNHQGLYWSSTEYNKAKAYFVCVSSGSYGGYNSGKYDNAVKNDSGKRCCAIKKF